MSGVVLLATGDTGEMWSGWTGPGSTAGQLIVFVGAVVLVVLGIFIWAAFVRKPRRRVHSYHDSSSNDGGLPRRHKRRSALARAFGKRRHRRRRGEGRERPLNPTLSQVGGLPQPQSRRDPPPGL